MTNYIIHDKEYLMVRGLPVLVSEIMQKQGDLEAQLFDESVFDTFDKKAACLNVISKLDNRLLSIRVSMNDHEYLPEYIDIGDKLWLYIPVGFDDHGTFKFGYSKERPVGVIAWFRRKRFYKGASFGKKTSRFSNGGFS